MRETADAIRFGTSGWRGVLGDDFTFAGVRAVARAVAEWARERTARPHVIVAHDTRFLGDRLAETAGAVLRAAGARPVRPAGPLPTPVATAAVRRRRAAAGLVFTASHNAPEYQGLKVVAPWGGPATPEITRDLEQRAARVLRRGPPPEARAPERAVDLCGPYRKALLARLDRPALARSRLRVIYDALHGAGAGVLDRMLQEAGLAVTLLRGAPDPRFGGAAPDPLPARLRDLARQVRRAGGPCLGIATDGDADRFRVIDADGRVLAESEALALLVEHLAQTGRLRRGVALSIATGSLVEGVARHHGLAVERFPIGFKYLSRALVDGVADVAGEESGGFAWSPLARDKDGMLAACLLAELVAHRRAPLRRTLERLRRRHGPSACGRTALAATAPRRAALARLLRNPPARIQGARVLNVGREDGLRLTLEDGFLMLRASGTEPLLRVYAEAPTARALARRLRAGARLLERAVGRSAAR